MSEMELSKQFIPAPMSSKLGWYEDFREQNVLLNNLSSNILLIGDSLISNISRYQDVWSQYFSERNTLKFSIPGDKVQSLLLRITNLKFSSNLTSSCIFIPCGIYSVDHNSPEEILSGLTSSGILVQAHCHRDKIVINLLLPRNIKFSLRRGNINIINALLELECPKHSLYTNNHGLFLSFLLFCLS